MIATQGSVPYPRQADTEQVMVLATNLLRIADLLDSNARQYERTVSITVGRTRGWTGDSAAAFERAMRGRAEQSRQSTQSARAVGEALIRHGHAVDQSVRQYEANARAERELRHRSPDAREAIDGTIVGQVQAVRSLAASASAAVPIVREAIKQLLRLTNRAAAESANPANPGTIASTRSLAADLSDTLTQVNAGTLRPDPNSRLGAYAATAGYAAGTVGEAVHNAIGTIYVGLGTGGEEQIGTVFNSAEARALYAKPLTPETSRQIAGIEHAYWERVRAENPLSLGGNLGSFFDVGTRDFLQRHLFSTRPRDVVAAPRSP
jgi:hypothetical protein